MSSNRWRDQLTSDWRSIHDRWAETLTSVVCTVGLLVLVGCAHQVPRAPTTPQPAVRIVSAADNPSDGPCIQTTHGCLAINPDVSQETLNQTVCVPGYTKAVRPSSTYTRGVKEKLLREAGLDVSRAKDFELDHRVPLALGGHPRKLSNLSLQPWDEANRKDLLEARLQRRVCAAQMTLLAAQACIAEDWRTCDERYRQ